MTSDEDQFAAMDDLAEFAHENADELLRRDRAAMPQEAA